MQSLYTEGKFEIIISDLLPLEISQFCYITTSSFPVTTRHLQYLLSLNFKEPRVSEPIYLHFRAMRPRR